MNIVERALAFAGSLQAVADRLEGLDAHVVYCPVELDPPPADPPWARANGAPVIGFVGRIEPRKGVLDLIAAAPAIRAGAPGAEVVIVGDDLWGAFPDYLAQVREAYPAVEGLGARAVAVATGAEFQARRLVDEGMPFPCLVDAEAALYRALGIGRVGLRAVLAPAMYRNYWQAWRRGSRQGQLTGDLRRLSGVAILDAAGEAG